MRTKIKIVAICLGYFVILSIILSAIAAWIIYTDPNRELIVDQLKSIIRPTVYLDCEVNVEEIKEIRIFTPFLLLNADEEREENLYVYTNPQKIEKIMNYFCSIKLSSVTERETLHNRSSDSSVGLYLKNGQKIDLITVYGDNLVRDLQSETRTKSGDLYRSKKGGVIRRINELDF